MRDARVSLLVPVAPRATWLEESLNSINNQVFNDWRLVIVLDGPCDKNDQVISRVTDPERTTVVRLRVQAGVASALNRGLERCTSEYVARLDADDRALPDRLNVQVCELDSRKGTVVLGTRAWLVNGSGSRVGSWDPVVGAAAVRRRLLWRNFMIHPSILMRREALTRVGGYRTYARGFEDYDLWLRLLAVGDIDNLPERLIEYRIHEGQVTRIWKPRGLEPQLRQVRRHATGHGVGSTLSADVKHFAMMAYFRVRPGSSEPPKPHPTTDRQLAS